MRCLWTVEGLALRRARPLLAGDQRGDEIEAGDVHASGWHVPNTGTSLMFRILEHESYRRGLPDRHSRLRQFLRLKWVGVR